MYKYILKRVLLLIPVIFCVTFLVYAIMEMASGDPISMIAPEATGEMYEQLKVQYGYDRSVFYRFFIYAKGLLRGDLGMSISLKVPVWDAYMSRLPASMQLALGAIVISHIISIPLGIFAAIRSGSLWDNGATVLSLIGLSMPNFWLGLLLIIAFSLTLGWFPSGNNTKGFVSLVLPAITIGTGHTAALTRTTRSSMVEVIRADYLRTARAKGLPERKVITKHALKNALIPVITISGSQFAGVLGGAVLTETVFTWPGVGRLLVDAIGQRDVPLATGCIIMTTILTCIILLVVDILYAYIDPRIKAKYIKGGK